MEPTRARATPLAVLGAQAHAYLEQAQAAATRRAYRAASTQRRAAALGRRARRTCARS